MIQESQCTSIFLMIRPVSFGFNKETAASNVFQKQDEAYDAHAVKTQAIKEFDALVGVLRDYGVEVLVIDDTLTPIKPDAVFPNNWFTTHSDGSLITYPMYAMLRRAERRDDIIHLLEKNYQVRNRYTFDHYEEEHKILEGTGSMVLDRTERIIYACLSPRTDAELLEHFALLKQYKKIVFRAKDPEGKEVYHTNVIMALGHDTAIVCIDCIEDELERDQLLTALSNTRKRLIPIRWDQVIQYAGNMLQVMNNRGEYLWVMSDSAYRSLHLDQIKELNASGQIISSPIPTIERYGGGSVRCMMAEIFLSKRR